MLEKARILDESKLKSLRKDFNKNKVNKVLQNAAGKTSLSQLAFVPEAKVGNYHNFSIDIKTMSATSQNKSGRCWIFAATNVLREIVAKKLKLQEFELSQNYVAFYDKLEKINYALESIVSLLDVDTDDRTLQTILHFGVGDGGQWDMFKSLVKKYGVCPKNVMDETNASSATWDSSFIINRELRDFAAKARRLHKEKKDAEVAKLKDKVLDDLYRVISIGFGSPVEKFDFEYVDKDGKYHLVKNLTPVKFYQKYIGNVIGGDPIFYLNLPLSELKELVLKQLKDGEVVWFGSDCGKYGDREAGLWAPEQYDYKLAYGIDLFMEKADMLDYAESAMNHAMVITGVNLVNDKPTKWKIENSWGTQVANKGYYTATDLWFDSFVYQAVVNVKYLNEKQKEALKKAPIHLNPWDPMGTLAK